LQGLQGEGTDREMCFEASVREEQAYDPFLSQSILFQFIAPLYLSTDQLLVLESPPLLKLVLENKNK